MFQMMMMIMILMMMNYFCGILDEKKVISLIFSLDHCQRSSPLQISGMLRAGFDTVQNLTLGCVERSWALVITTLHHTATFY